LTADLHLWTRGQPGIAAHEVFTDAMKDSNDESLRTIATHLFTQLTGAASSRAPVSPPARAEPVESARPPEPPAAPPPSSPAQSFFGRSSLAYTALALGAGFLVVGGAEAAQWIGDSNGSADDRQQIPKSVTDVCADMTRPQSLDACTKSKDALTASTLAWVFGGVGAVLAGTGVWLLATDHGASATTREVERAANRPRLELLPALEPRAGMLDVRVTY
jgi:hypothetical protein